MAFFRALIYGNFWISLGAMLWTIQSYLLKGLEIEWSIVILVGVATFWIYNLDRLLAYNYFKKGESKRHSWLHKNKSFLLVSSIVPSFILFGYVFLLDFNKLIYLGHLAVISLLYAIPFFRFEDKKKSLREISILKIFLISYVWAACTSSLAIEKELIDLFRPDLYFAERFVFIFTITLAFDIRDMRSDESFGLSTIPNKWGESKSKALALALLMVYSLICFYLYSNWDIRIIFILSSVLAATLILKAKEGGPDIYFTGLIDGLLLLQGLMFYFHLS